MYATTDNKRRAGLPVRIYRFYADGFRQMTVGRYLWAMILIKVAILFLVFKPLFFPDVLESHYNTDAERAKAVRQSLTAPRQAQPTSETAKQTNQ